MGGIIVGVIINGICALVFILFGLYALKKETPIHFWAGTTVKSEKISDVKAYNKANGVMWIIYGSLFVLAVLAILLKQPLIANIIIIIVYFPGIIILIIVYRSIYSKYKIENGEVNE